VSNPGQDGRVLSQSPTANQRVNRGDTVNIVVGRLQVAGPGD
jgi:beta-lactam-binding protein with PASTA domain